MILNKYLRRFLLERGLWLRFHAAILTCSGEPLRTLWILRKADLSNISNAFVWEITIEGFDYWEQIQTKWEIYYRMFSKSE